MSEQHWEIVDRGIVMNIDSPESLWEAAKTYFKWCKENPIERKTTLKTGKQAGTTSFEEIERPYTLEGLCLHCGITKEYLIDLQSTKTPDSVWALIASKIEYIITTQNTEMAVIGLFNPIMVSKILRLDNGDKNAPRPVTVNIIPGQPRLANSENDIENEIKAQQAV